ncbi:MULTISPECIES: hypothetical protein [Corynebacterium]|uniref:hypothetical protein n=1 Tax=Corynebacterium TaxID=1716 RepID=UPI00195C139D|nr:MULTISPECIES: hypothetical protein [Corynebacterium]MCG7441349.1 hypothetical protein [Corynebacterium sp. ACRPQ]MCG7460850.1 hypothetical protein [Corynebacterium sp. ACRPF]MCG7465620.1 hypothetical protein [Corynebacterium sp. ACRPJ]MCG7467319.1 hypothetical protein [Corynebacterium sp. ACRPE]MCT1427732.1 hypothetical protein [Corynebacterium sp. p3-SID1241]
MTQKKPLPEEIYKRRRVAALIIVLVLAVVLIWAAVAAFGGSSEEPADTAAPAPTSADEETSSSAAPESSGTVSETKTSAEGASESKAAESEPSSAAPASSEAAKKTCELADLDVRTSMLNYSVPEGELPKFFMTVTNPTAADCKIDLDKNLLRFEVYKMADNERVWSDTDCYASVQTGSQTFPAGKDVKFEAEWSRQASKPGECTDRPAAEPGAYFAHTVIGDNSSPPQDFTLR